MSVKLFVALAESSQRASTRFKVFNPSVGQDEALGTPIDQQYLKTLFKTSEGAADGGYGNSEFFCGTTQSASLSGSNEHHNIVGIVLGQSKMPFPESIAVVSSKSN
jgi:hypothetical protein